MAAESTEEFPEEKSLVGVLDRISGIEFFKQAPSKPQTPFGEMLTYYLKMEPQLFKTALEEQLQKLDKEANAARMEEETRNLDVEKNEEMLDLTLSKWECGEELCDMACLGEWRKCVRMNDDLHFRI